MRTRRTTAWVILTGIVGALWLATPAHADTFTATATPATVTLTPGGTAAGVVTLADTGANAIPVTVRAVVPDSSVTADLPVPTTTIPAGGSVAVAFTVRRVAEGAGQDTTVLLVVTSATGSAVAAVTVQAAANPAIVSAKIDSNVDSIDENHPGAADLVVSNPRDSTVTVTSVAVLAPTSTAVTVGCPTGGTIAAADGATTTDTKCTFTIPADAQRVLPVTFTADQSVVPGPRSATIQVGVTDGGVTSEVVATTSFAVTVFGESSILQALGVPAFLLLPGVIILLAAAFLIDRLSPWQPRTAADAPATVVGTVVGKVAGTTVLGVAVSLVVALIYPWLTSTLVPGRERNYLRAYGFLDFYYVFAYSLAIAVAVWGLAWLAYGIRAGYRALLVPMPDDNAPTVLRKLGRRWNVGMRQKFQKITKGDRGGVQLRQRKDVYVIAPRIVADVTGDRAAEVKANVDTLSDGDQLGQLSRLLNRRPAGVQVDVHFNGSDVPEVTTANRTDLRFGQSSVRFVLTQDE